MQKYPYARVLLGFPLISQLLANALEWYWHSGNAAQNFADWLNTNALIFSFIARHQYCC